MGAASDSDADPPQHTTEEYMNVRRLTVERQPRSTLVPVSLPSQAAQLNTSEVVGDRQRQVELRYAPSYRPAATGALACYSSAALISQPSLCKTLRLILKRKHDLEERVVAQAALRR